MTELNLVGFVYNPRVPEAARLVDRLASSLKLSGHSWMSSAESLEELGSRLSRTSVIVVVGGDGTILRTVRVAAPYSIPLVGVNLGRVGFMTELRADAAAERLPSYLNGDTRIEKRMMLQASVRSKNNATDHGTLHALNDVVMARGGVTRLLDIYATIDGGALTSYRADAVIVSTATGSTGYALSAGGPIIFPEARLMLIHPVAAHAGLRGGLVLPEESVVELWAGKESQATLSADGFSDLELSAEAVVVIQRSPYVASFLRANPPTDFYTRLTGRLGAVYSPEPLTRGPGEGT